jgi:hypothetical protein
MLRAEHVRASPGLRAYDMIMHCVRNQIHAVHAEWSLTASER